jgi:hypothetical protein
LPVGSTLGVKFGNELIGGITDLDHDVNAALGDQQAGIVAAP